MPLAAQILRSFSESKQIATLRELKEALGTISTMTVFRKLKTLGYRTSYSHRGKYTLSGRYSPLRCPGTLVLSQRLVLAPGANYAGYRPKFVEQSPAGFTAGNYRRC